MDAVDESREIHGWVKAYQIEPLLYSIEVSATATELF
jgi:hypothetical protein